MASSADQSPFDGLFGDEAPSTDGGDIYFDHNQAEDAVLRRLLKHFSRPQAEVSQAAHKRTGNYRLCMAALADIYHDFPDWLVVRRIKDPLGNSVGRTLCHPGSLPCFTAYLEARDLTPASKRENTVLVFGPLQGVSGRYLTLRLLPKYSEQFTTALLFPCADEDNKRYVMTSLVDYLSFVPQFWPD